ncbi:DUF4124 domain-containing protein [uncultured Thiodictyon sp.]|uniref:DUF4124 domain-containing protein n=1 Tax=uncultured Thiodictyon sp. TaxID=1846217 RepID=UPI0025F41225|nr:DUF4124 domain-containing protein [uncultured Thiodictyon sp.]
MNLVSIRSWIRPLTRPRGAWVIVCVLAVAGPVGAEAIFKSVDAEGRVTYSAAPPAGGARTVQELQVRTGAPDAPGETKTPATPPPETAPTPNPDQVRQAQQAVIQATAELEQTKIHGAEDWQVTPGGDRISTPDYERRVAAAQQKVQAAEAALERARRP